MQGVHCTPTVVVAKDATPVWRMGKRGSGRTAVGEMGVHL